MRHDNWVMVNFPHQFDDRMNPFFLEHSMPQFGKPVIALIENDCDNDAFVAKLIAVKGNGLSGVEGEPFLIWKIIDFDPETQEETLQQSYTVVAWKYVED